MNTIKWLYTMYRIMKIRKNLSFYQRKMFMEDLKPHVHHDPGRSIIAYPDAIFYVNGKNVKKALGKIDNKYKIN